MRRPRPELARLDLRTPGTTWIINQPAGLWTVTRCGEIIAARTENALGRKYPRTVFTGPAHATRLAAQLNHASGTQDYAVVQLQCQT